MSDMTGDHWVTCFQNTAEVILGRSAEELGAIMESKVSDYVHFSWRWWDIFVWVCRFVGDWSRVDMSRVDACSMSVISTSGTNTESVIWMIVLGWKSNGQCVCKRDLQVMDPATPCQGGHFQCELMFFLLLIPLGSTYWLIYIFIWQSKLLKLFWVAWFISLMVSRWQDESRLRVVAVDAKAVDFGEYGKQLQRQIDAVIPTLPAELSMWMNMYASVCLPVHHSIYHATNESGKVRMGGTVVICKL